MSDEDFNGQILAEKLGKLNSSQQSIESLSRWCIAHRKKAKLIVETWDKVFKSAPREQLVSFLYLANDILQNSRRKGSEFVNEFWKFLPAALKNVYDSGDESGKKAASRLVDIWEERKVFGSRGQNLKDEILGKNPPAMPTVSNGKSSNPIKVVKRDPQSLRIKLAVGGLPEKIISSFQSLYDEMVNEEVALDKCKTAISLVKLLENDIESSSLGNLVDSDVVEKLQEQENTLRYCVSQLENAEATRLALALHLKEALHDQESKLELIHSELQVARAQIEQAACSKQKLSSSVVRQATAGNPLMEGPRTVETNLLSTHLTNAPPAPAIHPSTFSSSKLNEEDSKKAMAAAVAAKLAASTSSAQMLTSVLSSLAAEEAASMSNGLNSSGSSSSLPFFSSPEKRLKLEKPASFSEVEHFEGNRPTLFGSLQQTVSIPVPSNGIQHRSQGIQIQTSFTHPPPPPSIPPANSATTQLGQSAAMMIGVMPYGYVTGNLPPPPPTHPQMGFARPVPLQTQQTPPQQLQNQQSPQQQAANGGYYRPPGIGFYGQSHQPATPPVPRQ